ncbi:MAG: M48 family metalloprotease [Bacteroidetes bacterium]|nr:M48 family metalloprotease [Bacteroidota bacterium]
MKTVTEWNSTFLSKVWIALVSIILFVLIYLLLLTTTFTVTWFACKYSLLLLFFKPHYITIILFISACVLGGLISFFLLKNLFKKEVIDRSGFIEISREEEPQLFALIDEVVNQTGAQPPLHVYLTPDTNASVFYDSSILSLFYPSGKNLSIGVGLLNSVTELELKAILGHEFGHFSQKSMTIGSYVYYINRIIYNLVQPDEDLNKTANTIAGLTNVLYGAVWLAMRATNGIQWIVKKLYLLVNKAYLGVSREMEFHADRIAVSITGYGPLETSLLRLQLADHSFNQVIQFYVNQEGSRTLNLYEHQSDLSAFLATESGLTVHNFIADINLQNTSHFNYSRLKITDQWSSHPSIADRIERAKSQDGPVCTDTRIRAITLLQYSEKWQSTFTSQFFEGLGRQENTVLHHAQDFLSAYKEQYEARQFDPVFCEYYDSRNPLTREQLRALQESGETHGHETVWFSKKLAEESQKLQALESDCQTIRQLIAGDVHLTHFELDGIRIRLKEAPAVLEQLQSEAETLSSSVLKQEATILSHIQELAEQSGKSDELTLFWDRYEQIDHLFDLNFPIIQTVQAEIAFMFEETKLDLIPKKIEAFRKTENQFKKAIESVLNHDLFSDQLTPAQREVLNNFKSDFQIYFKHPEYQDQSVKLLTESLTIMIEFHHESFFRQKKELLNLIAAIKKENSGDQISMTT